MANPRATLIEQVSMMVAMWADDNLFGHELDDDHYEDQCGRLADDLHEEIYHALADRPVR